MADHALRPRFHGRPIPFARALAVCCLLLAAGALAAAPPQSITVVTDVDYPPYLFRAADGRAQGLIKDKWELWSRTTGVPVRVEGMEWTAAQESVQQGAGDVLEAVSRTERRLSQYEFSPAYVPIEARVYFHRAISGISNDVASLRGFDVGAKSGSACSEWLIDAGLSFDSIRWYPDSESLVKAAGAGDVRLFCMDAPMAQHFLFKHDLARDFRESPPLYTTSFHWAVRKGRTELRDFIQAGFARIPARELQAIDERWLGNPLRFPIGMRYLYYAGLAVAVIFGMAVLLVAWNRALRKRVEARTAELSAALGSLRVHADALRESDTRLKLSIGASNIGLWDWNLADDSVYFSPEYKRQLGYRDDEMAGQYREWESRLHPEDKPRVLARLRACLSDPGQNYENDFRLLHRDGSYRWIYARGEILHDAGGRPCRVVGCHVDVTERKQAEAELAAQRTRFKSLVDHLPDHVFSLDAGGRYTLANLAWLTGSGFQAESEVLGKSVFDLLPPDTAARADAENRRIAETGAGVEEESVRVRSHDGVWRWVLITKVPLFDGDGRYAGLIGVRRDVTRLKEATDALARERNLLRSIVDNAPDIIYAKDLELRYVLMNREGMRLRGLDGVEAAIGRTAHDFLPRREAEASEEEDREVIRSGKAIINSQRVSFLVPGVERWISVSKVPLREQDGSVSGVLAIIRDVTPLKQAADELARERNLLRSLIDHAPVEIYLKDLDLRYVLMNDEALHLLGVGSVEEVIGKRSRDFFSAEAARAIELEDRQVIESGQPVLVPQRRRARDPSRWHSLAKVPLRDREGKVTGLLTLNRDITELHDAMEQVHALNVELEERVQRRTAELQDAVKELEAFSYSVSHDLRAPLRRVSGFLQILRKAAESRLSENEHGLMHRIAASVQRMDQLIEDMLRLSRVAGQEIHIAEVDLSALAEEVAADLRNADPARQVAIAVAPGLRARADPRLMRIVLENLLGNSWKFTGRSAVPSIEIGATADGGQQAYYVRDNGAGFDMNHAARLFGAFQRLHHADEFPGTGIGLATVARIVRRHGGRIWADASAGAGATFYFTLG